MGFKNHRGKKDGNHNDLVRVARQIGAQIFDMSGVGKAFPDLLAHLRHTVVIEVKQPDGAFALTQLRWLAEFQGYSAFVSNADELINVLRHPDTYCLSERDKRTILKICLQYEAQTKDKNPRITVSAFEKLFNEMRQPKKL